MGPLTDSVVLNLPPTENQWQPGSCITIVTVFTALADRVEPAACPTTSVSAQRARGTKTARGLRIAATPFVGPNGEAGLSCQPRARPTVRHRAPAAHQSRRTPMRHSVVAGNSTRDDH